MKWLTTALRATAKSRRALCRALGRKIKRTKTRSSTRDMNTMTQEEVAQLAIRKYEGTILLVASAQDLGRAIHVIRGEQVVGLDTETKPTFHKGQFHLPCLVQIATASVVYLFQLKRMGKNWRRTLNYKLLSRMKYDA